MKRGPLFVLCAVLLSTGCAQMPRQEVDKQAIVEAMEPSLRESAATSEANGDYEAAAGYYGSLHAMIPGDRASTLKLSQMLRYAGKAEEALALARQELEARPEDGDFQVELGKAHIDLGQPQDAIQALEKSKDLSPGNWQAYSALGVAYDYTGDWAKAQESYQIGLGFSPNNPVLHNNLALSLAQEGKLSEAIAYLERAIERFDATPRMRQNLALLKALQGRPHEAAPLLQHDMSTQRADKNMKFLQLLSDHRK